MKPNKMTPYKLLLERDISPEEFRFLEKYRIKNNIDNLSSFQKFFEPRTGQLNKSIYLHQFLKACYQHWLSQLNNCPKDFKEENIHQTIQAQLKIIHSLKKEPVPWLKNTREFVNRGFFEFSGQQRICHLSIKLVLGFISFMLIFSLTLQLILAKIKIDPDTYSQALKKNLILKSQALNLYNHSEVLKGRAVKAHLNLNEIQFLSSADEQRATQVCLSNITKNIEVKEELLGLRIISYKIFSNDKLLLQYFADNDNLAQKLLVKEKALNCQRNLEKILNSGDYNQKIQVIKEGHNYLGIVKNNREYLVVFSVDDQDAFYYETTAADLAANFKNNIELYLTTAYAQKCNFSAFRREVPINHNFNLGDPLPAISHGIARNHGFSNKYLLSDQQVATRLFAEIIGFKKEYDRIPAIFPVPECYINSAFGYRLHPITKKIEFHPGIDFSVEQGQKICAVGTGKVILANYVQGYGNLVLIYHGLGFSSLYAHCSQILVHKNDLVKRGSIIAFSGATGSVTGPHLHYEVRRWNKPINPILYLNRHLLYSRNIIN